MDSKYKFLTCVDPTKIPVTVGKKFSKLALRKPLEENRETTMDIPTQRVLFPEGVDEESEASEDYMTDDGSDGASQPDAENEDKDATHCSELDTQMSKLGLVSPPKRDSGNSVMRSVERVKKGLRDLGLPTQEVQPELNTQNMPSFHLTEEHQDDNASMNLSQEMRKHMEAEEEPANLTVLTISSDDGQAEHSESSEVIEGTPEVIVLDDSNDDVPLKDSIPIVSQLTEEKKSITSTIEQRLNAFFDKIPNASLSPHYSTNRLLVGESSEIAEKSPSQDAVELPETEEEVEEVGVKSDSGIEKGEKEQSVQKDDKSQTVNISAKIRINIQIEEVSSSSESEDDGKEDDAHDANEIPQTPPKKSTAEEGMELDKDMESILTEAYGDSWKTKEVLDSIKKKKRNQKRATNYNMFYRNIATDLESTRCNVEDKRCTPTSSTSKQQTPKERNEKARQVPRKEEAKNEPKYKKFLKICDSDSEYEGSNQSKSSEESWQMSSNDSNADSSSSFEVSPVQKTTKKKNTRRKLRKRQDLEFTQNASSDGDITFFENKLPTAIQESPKPITPKDKVVNPADKPLPTTKRKLFSKKLYNLENEIPSNDDEGERKATFKGKDLDEVISPLPGWALPTKTPKSINKKLDDVKKGTAAKSSTKTKGRDLNAPETASPYFSQKTDRKCYGFLISLTPTTPRQLSHPKALNFRENYRVLKEDLTTELYNRFNEKIFENQLKVPIKWNKKLLTTAGRCTNMQRSGVRMSEIELSEKVLTGADRLRCTLIHELCHAAAWTLDGEKKGHAANWKKWAAQANKIFPELPKITVSHNYDIEYKYTYECVQCGAKTKMHSKTKKVENIQCKYCKGAIQVFLNKKNKDGQIVQTPVREASGFAKFVKENYNIFKKPQLTHGEIMKTLGQEFTKINLK